MVWPFCLSSTVSDDAKFGSTDVGEVGRSLNTGSVGLSDGLTAGSRVDTGTLCVEVVTTVAGTEGWARLVVTGLVVGGVSLLGGGDPEQLRMKRQRATNTECERKAI